MGTRLGNTPVPVLGLEGFHISTENELRLAQSIGLEHGLERTGHPDMVTHLRAYYSLDEIRQFAAGLLFGWFWRVIVGRFG